MVSLAIDKLLIAIRHPIGFLDKFR